RDYVYIPLGGNRQSEFRTQVNLLIVFLLSGLWHGAYWTFIVWGAIHGVVFLFHRNLSTLKPLKIMGFFQKSTRLTGFISALTVFIYFSLSAVFFRSATVSEALDYFRHLWSPSLFTIPQHYSKVFILLPFILFEWYQRDQTHALQIGNWKTWQRWVTYYLFMALISYYFTTERSYIYFQF
ncbi:MAG TPA: hypothetical protein DIU20_12990, partial [Cryomorphaceae bacterium]|nr:hypothetical protein [Cryomorphaceae bacterium]